MVKPAVHQIRIAEVRVQDYRALRDVHLALRDITVLLGGNNTGKTSFLLSIAVALGHLRSTSEDLHIDSKQKQATSFEVDIKFHPWTGNEFDSATHAVIGSALRPPASNDGPEFFVVRATGKHDLRRGEFSVERRFLKGWAKDRDGARKIEKLSAPSISRDFNELIHFSLLTAQRDIVDDVGKKGTYWGKLTGDVDLDENVREELEAALTEVSDRLVGESPVLGSVQTHLQGVAAAMASGVATVTIQPVPTQLEQLVRSMDIQVSPPLGAAISIERQGMGTRSLAAILVYRAFLLHRSGFGSGMPLSIAAFEEPEAHLHPHAQRKVFKVIQEIPGQRILSTHSAYVASVADLFDFAVFTRSGENIKVASISEHDEKGNDTFTEAARLQVQRYIQQHNGEVLFARCVVLMEGVSEEAALPVFARSWWTDGPDSHGVSMIACGGAMSAKHFAKFLDGVGTPWIVFLDGDEAGRASLAKLTKELGREFTADSPEVVMLPKGTDFENQLLSHAKRATIVRGLESVLGMPGGLKKWGSKRHGEKYPKTEETRDYQSKGGKDRLVKDCMKSNKGIYGRPVAEAMVADASSSRDLPEAIRSLFERVESKLGIATDVSK